MPPNQYSYTVPIVHGATNPLVEERVSGPPPGGEGWGPNYYSTIGDAADQIINFHNALDSALLAWEFNQLTKPDSGIQLPLADIFETSIGDIVGFNEYEYEPECEGVQCITQLGIPNFSRGDQVRDRYTVGLSIFAEELTWDPSAPISEDSARILGHIIPSRNNALGQGLDTDATDSVVNDNYRIEIDGSRRGDEVALSNQGHSAQWYFTYEDRAFYWDQLLRSFELVQVASE